MEDHGPAISIVYEWVTSDVHRIRTVLYACAPAGHLRCSES